MTEDEELEYVCPECGEEIPADAKNCPSCDVVFASGEEEEKAVEVGPSAAEEVPVPEEEAAPSPGRKLYGGFLSIVGVVFVLLAAAALVGSLVLMNYDVWMSGASEETVGPRQGLFIGLGLLGFVICMAVAGYDLFRCRRGART